MKRLLLAALGAALAVPAPALLFGSDHNQPPAGMKAAWGLDGSRESKIYTVEQIATTVPANVLWPGDAPKMTFQIVNKGSVPLRGRAKIQTIRYRVRTLGDTLFEYAMDREAVEGEVPVTLDVPAGGYQNVTVSPLVPKRFGGYALILDVPGAGRKLAAGVVRSVPQESRRIQYPMLSLDHRDPAFLQRVGVRAIRYGIDYKPTTDPDFPAWLADQRRRLREYDRRNVTVLFMFMGGGPQPLGQMRSHLNDKGEGPMGYPGDLAWLPSADPDFEKYVRLLLREFGWPRGPVTGVHLWNEPWEGSSISGWHADMLRYREMYRAMARATLAERKEGADVLVGGCDSTSNALDKLFSDEDASFLPIFDFVSVHYQGLSSPYYIRPWRERTGPKGRVRIWDTESWAANTDERILPRLASWRAAGYDRLMGVDAAMLCDEWDAEVRLPDGKTERRHVVHAWSPAAAEGSVARRIGDRAFDRLLFGEGLPWAFSFRDPKRPDDGVVVVTGDIGAGTGGALRTVRRAANASLTLSASNAYGLFDAYGNPVPPVAGRYRIPLDASGWLLAATGRPGSFGRLTQAVRQARLSGIEPVEIVAADPTAPLGRGATLRVRLQNVLNRPLSGRVRATFAGVALPSRTVRLAPGQKIEIALPISGARVRGDNRYPATYAFDGGADGRVSRTETMRCNVVARLSPKVDGDLRDWAGALPQTIADAQASGATPNEQALFPYRNFDASTKRGYAAAYLAYDDANLYFAAKIADDTPSEGTLRTATRDDDVFFYPKTAFMVPRKDGPKFDPVRLDWPDGVRRYTYRKDPILPAGNAQGQFDNVQIAFNAIPEGDPRKTGLPFPPGTRPRYAVYPDTDYEYALNPVAPEYGGGTEIWRLAAPRLPRKHFYPRQPKSRYEGAVRGALVWRREGGTRIVECAIPWSEIPEVRALMRSGRPVRFTYRVNDDKGPSYELATNRSVSATNGITFHQDWVKHWTNELEFGWGR